MSLVSVTHSLLPDPWSNRCPECLSHGSDSLCPAQVSLLLLSPPKVWPDAWHTTSYFLAISRPELLVSSWSLGGAEQAESEPGRTWGTAQAPGAWLERSAEAGAEVSWTVRRSKHLEGRGKTWREGAAPVARKGVGLIEGNEDGGGDCGKD